MNAAALKVFAQRLRLHLRQHTIFVQHGQALDLIAAVAGLRSWPEVNAFPDRVAASSCDDEAYQRLASRIAARYSKTFSAHDLQKALDTPLPEKPGRILAKRPTLTEEPEPLNGNKVLKYVEVSEETGKETGRSASFTVVDLQPLQYSDLINQKLDKVIIPLRWNNTHVLESTIPEITVEKFASCKTVLESTYSSKTIGLVKGGWLPSGLALQEGMVVMPDRCTIANLFHRFRDGKKTESANDDFLDFFADQPIRINPLLFALEGNQKRNGNPPAKPPG